jgi:hypothetical protein
LPGQGQVRFRLVSMAEAQAAHGAARLRQPGRLSEHLPGA